MWRQPFPIDDDGGDDVGTEMFLRDFRNIVSSSEIWMIFRAIEAKLNNSQFHMRQSNFGMKMGSNISLKNFDMAS